MGGNNHQFPIPGALSGDSSTPWRRMLGGQELGCLEGLKLLRDEVMHSTRELKRRPRDWRKTGSLVLPSLRVYVLKPWETNQWY